MRDRRYRGKRGLTGEQVMIIAVSVILAAVAMTLWAGAEWFGTSVEDQLHYALFVLEDA